MCHGVIRAFSRAAGIAEGPGLRRFVAVVLGGALCGATVGCSSEPVGPEVTSTSVATAEAETTSTTEAATTTTLSEAAQRNADIDAARAEIIKVVEDWATFPVDTDLGEDGIESDLMTGRLRARRLETLRVIVEAGERLYYQGGGAVLLLDLRLDFDAGIASVDTCFRGDLQLDDSEGVMLDEASPDDWLAEFSVVRTESGWKIEEFYYYGPNPDAGSEGKPCVMG